MLLLDGLEDEDGEEELDGEVALWSVALLLLDGALVEGVLLLCELLDDDGVLWSDCGMLEVLLLDGLVLVEELPLTDEFDWLLAAGLVD